MELQLKDALDQGFGPEPPHRPVADRLSAGRTAVRRRRTALGAVAACLVVAALATASAVLIGGHPGSAVPADATDTAPATATASATAAPTPVPSVPDAQVGFDQDGHVVLGAPDVQVLTRIDAPLGYQDQDHHSVALDLVFDGVEQWDVAEWYRDSPGQPTAWVVITTPDQSAPATFEAWVATIASANAADNQPPPVRFDSTGRLVSDNDLVEVLQTTDHPELGATFAPPSAKVGAALLLIRGEGKRWVVARDVGDGIEVIPVPYLRGGETMAAFLDYARAKYAGGAGLR